MTTTTNNNNPPPTIYHQQVPIIEEEEFDDNDEGAFCSIIFSLYVYIFDVSVCTLTSVIENE
jgi:hypothetical protein